MRFIIPMLLLVTSGSKAVLWQRLSCPYEPTHKNLLRFWCWQSSTECCQGLTFSHSAHSADGGKLKVAQESDSFTVEALKTGPSGVYWCGVLSQNDTVIKLAEGYFHQSSAAFIWSLTRWILLPLLPAGTIVLFMCRAFLGLRRRDPGVNGVLDAEPESRPRPGAV